MAATLKDIADRLGVSPQAVSLALHKPEGTGRVSAELRERALAVAHELGYQPNRLARALVRGRSHFVGLLMLAALDHPYVEAVRGVDEEAAASGYGVLLCNAHGRKTAHEQLQTFVENQVEGIIAVAPSNVGLSDEVLARKPEGVPLVSINREILAPNVYSILMDNRSAVQQAAEHLIRLGHRRIAYLDQTPPSVTRPLQSSVERREGYLAAMQAAGLTPLIVSLPSQSFALRVAESARIAQQFTDSAQTKLAALEFMADPIAAAIEAMKALGVYAAIEPKIVQGATIAQAFQFVATGNAELGFVALSQLASVTAGSRWLVPDALYKPIRQDAVLLKKGADDVASRAFMAFLKGAESKAIIQKYGYVVE